MLILLLVALGALLGPAEPVSASRDPTTCRAEPPQGPSVPAPIVLRTSCGGFRLEPDGTITRVPHGLLEARTGGTGRTYGAGLTIERTRPGRIILLRRGRVVWRSSSLYRNDGGDVVFGPDACAFASYPRGIFVTDLERPERLIMRGVGLFPLAFLADRTLLVTRQGTITVLSPEGSVLRRYRYRGKNGFAFDHRTESLYFVTPRRILVRARGTVVDVVRPLQGLDGWISLLGVDRLVFHDDSATAVTRRDGRLVARASWSRSARWSLDSGVSASPDGRTFAFRLTRGHRAGRAGGVAVLHLVRAGRTDARAVYRHRLADSGCAVGASLTWHGGSLLYSSTDGHVAVLEPRRGKARPLVEIAAMLPRRLHGEKVTASWASDFRRP